MHVTILTAGILGLFAVLGYPVSRLLFRQLDRARASRGSPPASLLLAPLTGLGVFAIYTGSFAAAQRPMTAAFPGFWFLLAALWAGFAFLRRRGSRPASVRHPWLAGGVPLAAGFVTILALALVPFLQEPGRVFWHYAGSDGYMYMRIAEHVGQQGYGVLPAVGPYDGAAGFLAEVVRNFQAGVVQDKPAIMSSLGALSVLFGRPPHELFSPASCAAVGLLYLSLFVFGQVLVRLPGWAAAAFALFAACAPAAWMLYTHTFFGNLLALPFYVALLFLLRPFPTWGTAAGFGLLFGAQMALFPDGTIALFGVFGVVAPYLFWSAWRRRRLRRLLLVGGLAVGVTSVVVFMFGLRLWVTATGRLSAMFAGGPSHFTGASASAGPKAFTLKPLASIDWSWPALNLNYIPPRPLQAGERPYLFWLLAVLTIFVLVNLWRRRASQVIWYFVAFCLLFGIGWAGFFKSDYELFRGLAVFSYIPLALVCGLPWLLAARARHRAWLLGLGFAAIAPLLVHFVQVDGYHFKHGLVDHAADAQYTSAQLDDRATISRLAREHPMIAGSETPSFTAIANVMVLFSNMPLGLPACFHKFVFFHPVQADAAYAAPFVLRNRQYADVTDSSRLGQPLYASDSFAVIPNDLYPFYDNDTAPQLHPFPVAFLRQRNLPVARTFTTATTITFNSQKERPVSLVLQLSGASLPATLGYAFDGAAAQEAPVDPDGIVVLTSPLLPAGVHRISLPSPPQPLQISTVWLREGGASVMPEWQQMHLRARGLRAGELDVFRHMSPQPSRLYTQFGAALYGEFVSTHPVTRLYFEIPPGNRRLQTRIQLAAEAYENLPAEQATDGIQLEVAVLTGNQRTVVFTRTLDPARNPADRGAIPVDVTFPVPPQSEVEISVGPGAKGNLSHDWASIGPLRLD